MLLSQGQGALGRFAQKTVPPGTVRAKKNRTGRFLPGRFAPFFEN